MMIGALQVANIEHFLMKSLEADNQAVMEGGNSTAMEHYWDIAWGYLGSINADPDRISPLFLANYIEKEAVGMKGLENINVAVYHAFQAGRKAIVGNRTDEVRKQVGEIRGLLSKMLVLRTMFYLNESSKILRQKSETNSTSSISITWVRHWDSSWPCRLSRMQMVTISLRWTRRRNCMMP